MSVFIIFDIPLLTNIQNNPPPLKKINTTYVSFNYSLIFIISKNLSTHYGLTKIKFPFFVQGLS